MTIGEIENRVRVKLLDTYEDKYHFSPIEIFHAMRDGVRRIWSENPSSRYVNGALVGEMLVIGGVEAHFEIPESFPGQVGGAVRMLDDYRAFPLNMEDRWGEPLMYYVIHQMYMKDDPDTANANLSATYLQKFMDSVKA